jgi:hypothetical protein
MPRHANPNSPHRMRAPQALAVLLALITAGCAKTLTIQNHPAPHLLVDTQVFSQAGCIFDEHGRADCSASAELSALGCTSFDRTSDYLGGLSPALPMLKCIVEPWNTPEGESQGDFELEDGAYFYRRGCMLPSYVRYVAYREGSFTLVETEDQFRALFAPVESPEEALSFALALTGYSAYYGLAQEAGLEYFVRSLEDTHVEQTEDGYAVFLYHYQFCGCGPHNTYAIEVDVDRQGFLETKEPSAVFRNPQEDNLCVD